MSGLIDVHAHWLPAELFTLPAGAAFGAMHDRDGELYLDDIPLSIATSAMSDVAAIRKDMDTKGIDLRVLSAPPFAFPLGDSGQDVAYAEAFNAALTRVVDDADGALAGLGLVALGDPAVVTAQLEALASTPLISGVAIPPLVGRTSLDTGVLRHVLAEATRLDLAVLVHPMQLPRAEWQSYYLANLIGNPVETATAVAGLLLGGVKAELPGLRICFVHGGGCAPWLLGRWTHAWKARPDVRRASQTPPETGFGELFFDTVTHDARQLGLLQEVAGANRIACGSDYPFDMAEPDPGRFALEHGPGHDALVRAAEEFLGRTPKRERR
ncbi:amidohydrolase family protein [Mycolicibacterium sp. jd]|uniref:amidohydrolase family protein n=1 Tax=unclassified Mycolicibacterium TaxID=2636767 RepID=UPI00351AD123